MLDVAQRDGLLAGVDIRVPGEHARRNLTCAATAAVHLGASREAVRTAVASFPGVPHRLESVALTERFCAINDSAATIPEACLAAVEAVAVRGGPVVLIAGGSDKGLDPSPIVQAAQQVTRSGGAVVLLSGTGSDRIMAGCATAGIPLLGPASSMAHAVTLAVKAVERLQALRPRKIRAGMPGAAHPRTEPSSAVPTILLSPGCASFGMFRNEFDRGDQFRALMLQQ